MSLLVWRNTPTIGMNSSPAQRLFGRRLRNNLPIASTLLKPQIQTDVLERKQQNNEKQAQYYNRGAKDLPELNEGDTVRIKPSKYSSTWEKAVVREQVGIRSYKVENEQGVVLRRNRVHLRKTSEQFNETSNECEPSSNMSEANHAPMETTASESSRTQQTLTSTNDSSTATSQELRRSHRQRQQPIYLKDYKLQ